MKICAAIVTLSMAVTFASLYASGPATQPIVAIGDEINRPRYTGNGDYIIESYADPVQGLDELASRWGLKPYKIIKDKKYQRTGRVIFHDLRTGACVWRITDNPYEKERHMYSNCSSWSCNGAYFGFLGGHASLLNGDFSAEIDCPLTRASLVMDYERSAKDRNLPNIYYSYLRDKGLCKSDLMTGQTQVIVPPDKFEPMLADFPKARIVLVGGSSTDGQWIMGRAGGIQDEGRSIFAAKVDGSDFRTYTFPQGTGIHACIAAESNTPLLQVGNHKKSDSGVSSGVYNFDTGKYFELSGTPGQVHGHGAWKPNSLAKVHEDGSKEGGGIWFTDFETNKNFLVLKVHCADDHFSWLDGNPDWVSVSLNGQSGSDIVKFAPDGSFTAMKLCSPCQRFPMFTSYDTLAFGAESPDGTKIQFTSEMFGSVDEYLVVAKKPQPPADLTADKTTLTWKAPQYHREIKGYLVYGAVESGKTRICITPELVTGTKFVLPAGDKPRYYTVTSVEQSGLESNYSAEVCVDPAGNAWAGDCRIFIEAQSGEAALPLRPAFGPAVASDMYYIWQTQAGKEGRLKLIVNVPKDGKYYFAGRVSGNNNTGPWNLSVDGRNPSPLAADVPENQWKWDFWTGSNGPVGIDLTRGTHELVLSTTLDRNALDAVLVTTDPKWLPERYGNCQETAPQPVSGLGSSGQAENYVVLSWKPSLEKDIHHYNIYSSRDNDVRPTQKYLVASPAGPEFLDWGLRADTAYTYTITAVDRQGNESPAAPAISVKTLPHTIPIIKAQASAATPTSATVPFTSPKDDLFMIYAELRPDKSTRGGNTVKIELDGKPIGDAAVVYALAELYGGLGKESDYVWVPLIVKNPIGHRFDGFAIPAGKHELKLSSDNLDLRKVQITNDFNLKPEGKINTLYPE